MRKTQLYFWTAEACRDREDLSDDERTGRSPDVGLDEVLAHKLEADPHTTTCKIADSLGTSPQILINDMRDGLVMGSSHSDGSPKRREGIVGTRND
jgi:hypothetical protein